MLRLAEVAYHEMLAHALRGLPHEACGLMVGRGGDAIVTRFFATENEAKSAKVYTIPAKDHLRIDRDLEDEASGESIIGVMHSHTHTDAYPSPTDVEQAPDPEWHYVIVSLRQPEPSLRSYRIVDGEISEEPVMVIDS